MPENIFETLSIAIIIFIGLLVFGLFSFFEQAYTYLFSTPHQAIKRPTN